MDFHDTPDEAAFRKEVRDWFTANVPAPQRGIDVDVLRRWQATMAAAGWVGLDWPPEYGGRGASLVEQAIFNEEVARARAPISINAIGLNMSGPTIMACGTPEQKARYLPPILTAEEIWCQGFSEPGAGSDLAAIRTRAVADGDDFVVDGQKVWTSLARHADWCALLAVTDPAAPRYRGLTYFILDMRTPGVDVRPLRELTGQADFCEVFLDGVRIPRANVLGAVDGGWKVAMATLLHERGTWGFTLVTTARILLDELYELARTTGTGGDPAITEPVVRAELGDLHVAVQGMWLNAIRALSATMRTGTPGPEGSLSKLAWSETMQRITSLGLRILGTGGLLDEATPWPDLYLRSLANTIEAGTSEIQRNTIAERILGLPRS